MSSKGKKIKRAVISLSLMMVLSSCTSMADYDYAIKGNPTINTPTDFPSVDSDELKAKEEMSSVDSMVITNSSSVVKFYNSVWFDNASYAIKDSNDVNLVLMSTLTYLKKHPKATVAVNGYASELGTARENKVLSTQRANAIKKYFINNGVSAKNITVFSYGSKKNKFTDNGYTDKNNPSNRRVDIMFVKDKPIGNMTYTVNTLGMPIVTIKTSVEKKEKVVDTQTPSDIQNEPEEYLPQSSDN